MIEVYHPKINAADLKSVHPAYIKIPGRTYTQDEFDLIREGLALVEQVNASVKDSKSFGMLHSSFDLWINAFNKKAFDAERQ